MVKKKHSASRGKQQHQQPASSAQYNDDIDSSSSSVTVTKNVKGGSASAWKRALLSAVALPLIAVLFSKLSFGGAVLTYVDVSDEQLLRRVFFPADGEVWAVACETSAERDIPEHLESVAMRLSDEMKFAVIDCSAKLPGSGRTTMQRWKLRTSDKPVMFVANGAQTQQLPSTRSEYDLVRELRLAAIRRPHDVRNDETFHERCLSKSKCMLVLRGGAELEPHTLKSLHELAGEFAGRVTFASVDAAEWRLANLEGFEIGDKVKLRRFEAGSHRAIYLSNDTQTPFIKALAPKSFSSLGPFLRSVTDDNLVALADENDPTQPLHLSLLKRPRRQPRPKPPPPSDEMADAEQQPPQPKNPQDQSAQESAEQLAKMQREREARRRDQMEREAANSAFVAESASDESDAEQHQAELDDTRTNEERELVHDLDEDDFQDLDEE